MLMVLMLCRHFPYCSQNTDFSILQLIAYFTDIYGASVPGHSILHLQDFRPNLPRVYCLSTNRLSGFITSLDNSFKQ